MMQMNDIQQRFNSAQQCIQQAAQACSAARNVSPALQDCIKQLNSEASQAQQEIRSQDQTRITQCVDKLEQLSDRAKSEAQQTGNLDDSVRSAVQQMHDQLSSLKHQLH